MSPHRPVTLTRFKVGCAFLALALSYIIGLAALTHDLNTSRSLRREQVVALHESALQSCASRHKLTLVLEQIIHRSIVQTKHLRLAGFSEKAREDALRDGRRALRDLRTADCRRVPVVPTG